MKVVALNTARGRKDVEHSPPLLSSFLQWVEDIMVQVIRSGVEIIGQEYVKGRTYGRLLKNAKNEGESLFNEEDEEAGTGGSKEKDATAAA